MQNVWQIASGESGRKYTDLFLKHDVMLYGPGRFGPFDEARYQAVIANGSHSASNIAFVRRFAMEVRPGDVVLLRSGYRVEAVGLVHQYAYSHNPTFDDVHGWDLEHSCRVMWQHELTEELTAIQAKQPLFGSRKSVPAFTAVEDNAILQPIKHLFPRCTERPLRGLPPEPAKPLTMDEVAEALFARGLGFDAVHRLRAALEKQRRLISWYESSGFAGNRPTEHEVVAHVILPLLSALGWSEQLIAIEWHKIDLALFSGTPTDHSRCRLVCEAKIMGHGLQDVFAQAKRYTESLKLDACEKILLADGGRFYLFRRRNGVWDEQPSGYLNVQKIRTNHLHPANTNAIDTIMALTPMMIAE